MTSTIQTFWLPLIRMVKAYPYGDLNIKVEDLERGDPVAPINNFNEAFWHDRQCYRCPYRSCGFNPLFVKEGGLSVRFAKVGIKANLCINIDKLIFDKQVNVALRDRVQMAVDDFYLTKNPMKLYELCEAEGGQYPVPFSQDGYINDGVARPANLSGNGINKQIKDIFGEDAGRLPC